MAQRLGSIRHIQPGQSPVSLLISIEESSQRKADCAHNVADLQVSPALVQHVLRSRRQHTQVLGVQQQAADVSFRFTAHHHDCLQRQQQTTKPTCASAGVFGCMPCHDIVSEVHLDGSPTVCTLYCTGQAPMPGAYAPIPAPTSATPPTGNACMTCMYLLWAFDCTCPQHIVRNFDDIHMRLDAQSSYRSDFQDRFTGCCVFLSQGCHAPTRGRVRRASSAAAHACRVKSAPPCAQVSAYACSAPHSLSSSRARSEAARAMTGTPARSRAPTQVSASQTQVRTSSTHTAC